ncbi:MAG: DUF2339 domain-containing protein [Myxococcota bacterium]|nr:DUF2339 domain-containing protein [Myxococcota bacterium]
MEIIAGLLCAALAVVGPIWVLVRFSHQRLQLRTLQAESDELRLLLSQLEHMMLARVVALENRLQPMVAAGASRARALPQPGLVATPRSLTIAAPLLDRAPPPKTRPDAPVQPSPVPAPDVPSPPVPADSPAPKPLLSDAPAAAGGRIERTMVWVIAAVGGGAVALSGLIFFAGALASGTTPPAIRVLLGLALGGAGMGIGEVLWRRQSAGPAAAVSGAGAGLLHGALYACAVRYGLVPVEVVFVAMLGVTGLTAWRAEQHRSLLLTGLALLAGFATPLMLATGESRPVLLIGYLALLNAGMLVSAIRHQWRGLIAGGGVLTVLMLSGWAIRFLTPGQLPVAVLGAGLLSAIFLLAGILREEPGGADRMAGAVGVLLGGAAPALMLSQGTEPLLLAGVLAAWVGSAAAAGARRGWTELSYTGGGLSVCAMIAAALLLPEANTILAAVSLGASGLVAAALREDLRSLALPGLLIGLIGAALTVSGSLADSPLLLIELAGLAGLAGVVSLRRDQPWLVDVAGVALVVLASLSAAPLQTAGALAVLSALGALRISRAGLWAPVLGAAGLALPLLLGDLTPAALGYLLALSAMGAGLAWRLCRPSIALLTAGLVGALQITMAAIGHIDGGLSVLLFLLVPPLLTAASTRREPAILGSTTAAMVAGGLLLSASPSMLLLAPAVLGLALSILAPAALPLAVLYGTVGLLAMEGGAPEVRLVVAWSLTLGALTVPTFRADRMTHQTAILAGGVLFVPAHLAWQALAGGALGGLQAALVAGLTLAAAIRARRQGQQTGLAELLVLGFATAAVVIQLSGPWLVLGLAAELVALAELQRRAPLALLRIGAVVLAGAVATLLLNPTALQWSGNPVIWALPAGALLWSGERLRGWRVQPGRMVQLGGVLLLFAAVDLSILGLFGGAGLRIASLAGEMVRSLAWAGFGLAMMGVGVRMRRKPARLLALAFLCLAAGKVFLADLWQLHGMIRVGSIMGLGIFLLVAAVMLQRVVLSESEAA